MTLSAADAEAISYAVVDEAFLASESIASDVVTLKVTLDSDGYSHTRYQQTYDDLPVFEAQYIVHLQPDGTVYVTTDALKRDIAVDTSPTLTAEDAIQLAMLDDKAWDGQYNVVAELMIFARDTVPTLVWRVQLEQVDDQGNVANLPIYFMDAGTGEIILTYDNLMTGAAVGTGSGFWTYSQNIQLNTYQKGGIYYMQDTPGITTYERRIVTVDGRTLPFGKWNIPDGDNLWGDADPYPENPNDPDLQRPAVDAHFAAKGAFDYFAATHGWNGIDGDYGPRSHIGVDFLPAIALRVHALISGTTTNASWNGYLINLGDGSFDDEWGPFTTVDIVGHEWTHGVTETQIGLTYYGESGALNESWSDVFGELVERDMFGTNDWLLGQNWKVSDDTLSLRSLSNPHDGKNDDTIPGDEQPDHYSERYLGDYDNGGVHINSGISNYVFYLASVGGTHHLGGTALGMGVTKMEAIWYKAYEYLTPGASFATARQATLEATGQLYGFGGIEYTYLYQAWYLCGVSEVAGNIYTDAGTGSPGYGGDGGQATAAQLLTPRDMVVDLSGNLFIADTINHRVRKVSPDGIISTIAGTGVLGYSGDGGLATDAELNVPQAVAVSDVGEIYISDFDNNRIRKIDSNGIITTVVGNGSGGFSGDGGSPTSAQIYGPSGLGFDLNGDLHFADERNHRIRIIKWADDSIDTIVGNGSVAFNGDGGLIESSLYYPTDVAFDEYGHYGYIADSFHHRIRRYSYLGTGNLTTVVGVGTGGYSGDGGAPDAAELNYPQGVSVWNPSGEFVPNYELEVVLYIADKDNDRVREADLINNVITTFAGTGIGGYDGDGLASQKKIWNPYDTFVDSRGHVYIADTYNHRVRRVVQ